MSLYPTWPDELPASPLRDGYGRGLADGRSFQAMGRGAPRIRLRTRSAIRPMSMTFRLTTAQLARFERFWDEDTDGGSLPFYIPDPVRHGASIVSTGGIPMFLASAWMTVVFAEGPPDARAFEYDAYDQAVTLSVLP